MAAATAVFQSLLPGDHVLVSRVLYWGVRKWLAEFGLTWGLDVEFTDTGDLAALAAAIRPGRTRLSGRRRRRTRCGRSPTWPPSARSPIPPGCGWPSTTRWRPGAHPAVGARRRHSRALGHQVPQRAQRRAGGRGADRPPRPVLGADPVLAAQRRRRAGPVRGMAAAAGHAHPVPAGAPRIRDRPGDRHPLPRPPGGGGRALPGAAVASGPPDRGPPDERRVRGDAVDPAGRRAPHAWR